MDSIQGISNLYLYFHSSHLVNHKRSNNEFIYRHKISWDLMSRIIITRWQKSTSRLAVAWREMVTSFMIENHFTWYLSHRRENESLNNRRSSRQRLKTIINIHNGAMLFLVWKLILCLVNKIQESSKSMFVNYNK